tara:strand:- start:4475 stop:4834 length:360 start_codon:yes stop_codon:yes gene_type:complete
MTLQALTFLRYIMIAALAAGIFLSSNAQSDPHDLAQLAQILTDHKLEVEHHGHAHEDIVDILHAYQSHGPELADHDHNIAFLTPRGNNGIAQTASTVWAPTATILSGRRSFDLDRPPRV